MRLLLLTAAFFLSLTMGAQHTGYSFKAGPTMGVQQWNSFDRGPLFGYHADIQVENISETDARTLYASLGYHQRGSANRFSYVTVDGRRFQSTTKFIFNNVGLVAGGKQIYPVGVNMQGHVALGLRGEVNVSTSYGEDDEIVRNNPQLLTSYPQDAFVNRFLYGIDIGAGLDFPLSPTLDGLLEIRVSPDLSRQYFQPPFVGYDPISGNNNRNFPERRINNISFELSFGIRLIRYSE